MLHILLPIAFILGPSFAMHIHSISISLIVFPLTLIVVSICVNELSFSFGFVIGPLTLIDSCVWPFLFSESIANVAYPFPLVLNSIFKANHRLSLPPEPITIILLFDKHLCVSIIELLLLYLLKSLKIFIHPKNISFFLFVLLDHFGLNLNRLLLFDWSQPWLAEFVPERLGNVVANALAIGIIAHGSVIIIIMQ